MGNIPNVCSSSQLRGHCGPELDTDWIYPWTGLDWVGLDLIQLWQELRRLDWIGSDDR